MRSDYVKAFYKKAWQKALNFGKDGGAFSPRSLYHNVNKQGVGMAEFKSPQNQNKKADADFGEYLPGYLQTGLFDADEPSAHKADEVVKNKMVRQLGFILTLLLIQMILFFILIKLTLGFSF